MTVNTISSVAEFVTNGVTTNFPFYFKFLANEDLVVTYVNPAGISSTLTLGTHYTANGAGNDAGGSVATTTALAGPGQLVVSREMMAFQQTSLRNQGKFLAETHEDVFDRLTMLIQQGFAIFKRAMTRPLGREYFFGEGRRITSLQDPIDQQDAATKNYTQTYVGSVLGAITGPINNAANVLFVDRNGLPKVVQDLSINAGMMIGYTAPIPGAVNRALIDKFMEQITVKDFGAACTGLTDDTVFVQSAIDFCAASGWPPLVVPGRCLITAPLNIDRMVDSTTSEFRIIAKGANAGFHTTTSIEMFTSRIPMTTSPVSEFVTFEGVMFTCDNHVTAPRVLSKKFLRMKFLNCYFSKVRFMVSDAYAQSFFLSNCNIRAWQSSWFVADHAFDVDFDGCISEFGNGYLAVIPNGCYGVRFRGGVHEGSGGGLVTAGLARSLLVSGYYGEGNNQSFLEFGAGGQNTNITVLSTWISSTAANIANPNFYEINWGSTLNPVSIGNSAFNGRLHDDALLPATTTAPILYSTGDSAGLTLYKTPHFADKGTGSWPLAIGTGSGTVNYAKYVRSGTQIDVEFSFVFSGTSGSPAVITGLPLSSVNAFIVGTVSYSDQTGEVYLIGGAGAGNGCTGSSFAVCKTKQGAAYSYTELNGKLIVGRISYMI